jgi:hypothetical protein
VDGSDSYRFREEVLHAAASRTRRRLLASFAAAAAAIVGVWAAALRGQGAGPSTLAFSLALLAVLAALSLRRRLRRLHVRWSSFEVRLDAEAIAREVSGFPGVRIARADVASIAEQAAGIVVRDRAGTSLLVPREIDGYERAREALAAWGTGR